MAARTRRSHHQRRSGQSCLLIREFCLRNSLACEGAIKGVLLAAVSLFRKSVIGLFHKLRKAVPRPHRATATAHNPTM